MTNCWPSRSDSDWPIRRAMMSVAPPGAKPTMMRTGRVGYACAQANREMAGSAAAPAARCRKFRRGSFIFEPPFTSFDYLVGAGEQCWWYGEAEHPGGLLVDDELELGRLHDRQIRRLCALEDATGIYAHLTRGIRQACSVAHQPTSLGILPRCKRGRDPVERRQEGQLDAPGAEKGAAADEEGVGSLAHKRRKRCIDLAAGVGVEDPD